MTVPTASKTRNRSGKWLAVAIVVACVLLWGGVQASSFVRAARQAHVIERIEQCGGIVWYEWEVDENLEPTDIIIFHQPKRDLPAILGQLAGRTDHDAIVFVEFGGIFPVSDNALPPPVLEEAQNEDLLSVTAFPRLRRVAIRESPPQRRLTESTARELVASHGVPAVSFAFRAADGTRRVTLYERTAKGVSTKTTYLPPR